MFAHRCDVTYIGQHNDNIRMTLIEIRALLSCSVMTTSFVVSMVAKETLDMWSDRMSLFRADVVALEACRCNGICVSSVSVVCLFYADNYASTMRQFNVTEM